MFKKITFPEVVSSKNLCLFWFLTLHLTGSAFAEVAVREYITSSNFTVTIKQFSDRGALGSWSFPIPEGPEGIEGWLMYANPPQACGPIEAPPKSSVNTKPWIVLAKRHNCTFGDKAQAAEDAGYSAIIIHNVDSDQPMTMGGGGVQVRIPVVSIGQGQAYVLKQFTYWNKGPLYTVRITDDMDITWLEKYLWPFFGVVTGCFCCMGIYILVKWGLERRRQRRIASRRRLSTKQLNKIPTKKYKKGDSYEVCAICLEDYEENEKLRILPCNHAYHTKCVDPWLTKSRKFCPVCKRKILTKKEKEKQREKEEREEQRREESQRREEEEDAENNRGEEEEEERGETTGGESSEEEESEERESEEAQPLIQDPPLTIVDRLRRFFRRRQTIEVEVDDSESTAQTRDNQFRSSYGSLGHGDPINSQIEAAENHLQQHMQNAEELTGSSEDHLRRHFQSHNNEHLRQMPTTVAVHATVHVEHHPPQPGSEEEDGHSESNTNIV